MPEGKHQLYEFGGFQLDPVRYTLLRQGEPVALAPKVFDTLVLLVENRGRVLEKEELIQALWPETFVEEGNLSQNIFLLRKLLGDDRNGHSVIHTVPRKGYEFVAPVTETETTTAAIDPRITEYWSRHSPFRSLQTFEPEDAWLFFGRDAEVHDLLRRLKRSPVLTMVGNSGSGKSSLLRAGLIPTLRAGRFCNESSPVGVNGSIAGSPSGSWRIAVLRPSAAPFDYLAEVLPSQLAPELGIKEQAEFIADYRSKLREGGDALRNAISALVLAATEDTEKAGRMRVVLVVDQFEELFTLTSKPEIRDQYVDCLLAAACWDSAVPVHLVLALRADFYGCCLDHAGLSRCLETNLYNVPRMTPEQMRETIEKRLQLAGGRAEPGLIDSLLEDVGAEPGNLALLEHALGQLWERCGGPGCTFTSRAYNEIGRLRGALGRHADDVYQSLATGEQKRLAQKIFLELVHLGEGAQDTRRRVPKAELLGLAEPGEVEALLARLATARLIATGREGEESFVEVSHEALIREWPALREWIRQNREELALERRLLQAAEEWSDLNRDPGALLQGTRLAQGEDWLGRHQDAHDLLREYLEAGIEARAAAARKEREAQERQLNQQRTTARRFRWFSYALAVLVLVAVGAAAFAYHLRTLEKSRAMAAQAEELATRDHGQALDLAIRSWQIAKTDEARIAVAKTFPVQIFVLNHDDSVYRTVFSPDGERILSAAHDRGARLWSAGDGHLLAVLPHDAPIFHAEFSADGQRIVTASEDHTARVWDGTDGHLVAVLKGHKSWVWRAAFSPDGKRVVTASSDHTACVWDSADGHLLLTLEGHSDYVLAAQFSPDGKRIVTASQDKTARVWNSANGQLTAVLQGHSDIVAFAEFSPDSQRIVTASYDGSARVWNSADGQLLTVLKHQGALVRAAFSHDGQRIVTASSDNTARVWNSSDGRLLATLRHEGPVVHVEFSPDGRRIATASTDHTARVWNSSDGRLLAILQGHSREVFHAAFSPSGEQIVTGSGDHTVRVWNLLAGRSTAILRHNSILTSAAFSPDGRLIVTASVDRTARIWKPDGQLRSTLQGHSDTVFQAAFSSDGQRIVTSSGDGTARIWNSLDGRLLAVLRGHTDKVANAAFSPDGLQIVTASFDHTARIWNGSDGHLRSTLQGHSDAILQAAFSSDGQRIVTASLDGTARVWNSEDGRLLAILRPHSGKTIDAAFSPDGLQIVTASSDRTASLWNTTDGSLVAVLQGHTNSISHVQFSPDGRRVFTTGWDHTTRIWNSTDGKLLGVLQGHSEVVLRCNFSPDGQRIATSSMDQTARLWNAADGHLQASLQGHHGWVLDVNFSPDGRRIVTASYDQTGRVWRILTLDDMERILAK
jgi:WD40 repeat protein/DNA-binding winged helix-turn-helix (wHTH) protein